MIRTISSEFDCVDTAEIAAAAIKKSNPDITRITIKPKKNLNNLDKHNYNGGLMAYSYTGQFFPYGTDLYGSQTISSIANTNNYNNNNSFNEPQEVTLKIKCTNDSLKKVSAMLTNYGGLKIKEQ